MRAPALIRAGWRPGPQPTGRPGGLSSSGAGACSTVEVRGNAVKHVSQPRFELLLPDVLGQPSGPAVHGREPPGFDVVRGIDQLERAVSILDRLSLPGGPGWAQPSRDRI